MIKKTVSIVVPCYNEEEALPLFFAAVCPAVGKIGGYRFRYVLVDDGSTDSTAAVMEGIRRSRDDVTVVRLSRNFGQNPAFRAGLSVVKTDYAVTMDADLQDPPEVIEDICARFSEGYEVVSPHRADRKRDTWFKRKTAGAFYRFVNRIEGREAIAENVGCFRGLSKRAVDIINALPEKDGLLVTECPFVGLKRTQVDYARPKRSAGKTKYSLRKMVKYAFGIVSAGTSAPLMWASVLGVLLTASGVLGFLASLTFAVLGAFGILVKCGSAWHAVTVCACMASAVLTAAGAVQTSVGVNGVYERNILDNTRGRPQYVIDAVEGPERKTEGEDA